MLSLKHYGVKFVSTPMGFKVDSNEQQQSGALLSAWEVHQSTRLPNGSLMLVYHFSAGCKQLPFGKLLTSSFWSATAITSQFSIFEDTKLLDVLVSFDYFSYLIFFYLLKVYLINRNNIAKYARLMLLWRICRIQCLSNPWTFQHFATS